MKDLVKIIEQESYEYRDPITGSILCHARSSDHHTLKELYCMCVLAQLITAFACTANYCICLQNTDCRKIWTPN